MQIIKIFKKYTGKILKKITLLTNQEHYLQRVQINKKSGLKKLLTVIIIKTNKE